MYQLLNRNGDIKLQQEPICNIPYEIRKNDPNLRDKATHRIITDKGQILIGERVVSIMTNIPYTTWKDASAFVYDVIEQFDSNNIIKKINSINIRYINFFETNIFDNINLSIGFNEKMINYPATILKTEIPSDDNKLISVLQIANSVHIKNDSLGLDNDGSLIDITVVCKSISDKIRSIIEQIHNEEEQIFFKLLKEDFVDKLK